MSDIQNFAKIVEKRELFWDKYHQPNEQSGDPYYLDGRQEAFLESGDPAYLYGMYAIDMDTELSTKEQDELSRIFTSGTRLEKFTASAFLKAFIANY